MKFDRLFLWVIGVILIGGITVASVIAMRTAPYDGDAAAAFAAKDYEVALVLWQAEALKGDREALVHIGWLYENALGVFQNYAMAAEAYRRAADSGTV